MNARTFTLQRATPPITSMVGDLLRTTLEDLSHAAQVDDDFHNHRHGGTLQDRRAAATWMSRRLSETPDPELVLVTNGTQNSLFMLLAAIVGQGNCLAVEELSYPQVGTLCKLLGCRTVSIEVDAFGMIPDKLRQACVTRAIKAVYIVPTIHNPTASVMPAERRQQIVEIAREFGVHIIEDDAQGLLANDPPPPIASFGPDVTWYVLTLSKCLSVGLRIGYILAPSRSEMSRLTSSFSKMSMWFSSPLSATIASRWIDNGQADLILGSLRQEMSRRHAIAASLIPWYVEGSAGLHIWIPAPRKWCDFDIAERARAGGVLVRGGTEFATNGEMHFGGARVSLSQGDLGELRSALGQLRDALARGAM